MPRLLSFPRCIGRCDLFDVKISRFLAKNVHVILMLIMRVFAHMHDFTCIEAASVKIARDLKITSIGFYMKIVFSTAMLLASAQMRGDIFLNVHG